MRPTGYCYDFVKQNATSAGVAIYITLATLIDMLTKSDVVKIGGHCGNVHSITRLGNDQYDVEIDTNEPYCKNVRVTTKKPPVVTRDQLFGFMRLSAPVAVVFYCHQGEQHEGIVEGITRVGKDGLDFSVVYIKANGEKKFAFVKCNE